LRLARKRSASAGQDARWRLTRHVLGDDKLAPLPVRKAAPAVLSSWRRRLPKDMRPATINRLHYSRFITSEVEAAARGAIVSLAPAQMMQLGAVS
jgi:hypothetical protein